MSTKNLADLERVYLIQRSDTFEFYGGYGCWSPDINEARIYFRRCDATNSLHLWYPHKYLTRDLRQEGQVNSEWTNLQSVDFFIREYLTQVNLRPQNKYVYNPSYDHKYYYHCNY